MNGDHSLLSSVLWRISSLHQEALVAQGQVHLATLETLLSMTDKASGCREVQGAKGRVELRLFMLGSWQSHTPEVGTMLLDQ